MARPNFPGLRISETGASDTRDYFRHLFLKWHGFHPKASPMPFIVVTSCYNDGLELLGGGIKPRQA